MEPECQCACHAAEFAEFAQGWRSLARRIYADLLDLRGQVLRYRVPDDAHYIQALNRVDSLMREHDATLREPVRVGSSGAAGPRRLD